MITENVSVVPRKRGRPPLSSMSLNKDNVRTYSPFRRSERKTKAFDVTQKLVVLFPGSDFSSILGLRSDDFREFQVLQESVLEDFNVSNLVPSDITIPKVVELPIQRNKVPSDLQTDCADYQSVYCEYDADSDDELFVKSSLNSHNICDPESVGNPTFEGQQISLRCFEKLMSVLEEDLEQTKLCDSLKIAVELLGGFQHLLVKRSKMDDEPREWFAQVLSIIAEKQSLFSQQDSIPSGILHPPSDFEFSDDLLELSAALLDCFDDGDAVNEVSKESVCGASGPAVINSIDSECDNGMQKNNQWGALSCQQLSILVEERKACLLLVDTLVTNEKIFFTNRSPHIVLSLVLRVYWYWVEKRSGQRSSLIRCYHSVSSDCGNRSKIGAYILKGEKDFVNRVVHEVKGILEDVLKKNNIILLSVPSGDSVTLSLSTAAESSSGNEEHEDSRNGQSVQALNSQNESSATEPQRKRGRPPKLRIATKPDAINHSFTRKRGRPPKKNAADFSNSEFDDSVAFESSLDESFQSIEHRSDTGDTNENLDAYKEGSIKVDFTYSNQKHLPLSASIGTKSDFEIPVVLKVTENGIFIKNCPFVIPKDNDSTMKSCASSSNGNLLSAPPGWESLVASITKPVPILVGKPEVNRTHHDRKQPAQIRVGNVLINRDSAVPLSSKPETIINSCIETVPVLTNKPLNCGEFLSCNACLRGKGDRENKCRKQMRSYSKCGRGLHLDSGESDIEEYEVSKYSSMRRDFVRHFPEGKW